MNKPLIGAVTALSIIGSSLAAVPAAAQDWRQRHYDARYDRNGDGYDDRYDRDHNGYDDGYDDRYDRNRNGYDDRYERRDRDRNHDRRWQYYGGSYGYNGYRGQWRTGQRYPYYNQSGYYLNDYRAYGLPTPRPGYRYYRDDNGDVVMAAIAGGVIGLILGGALDDNHRHRGW